MKNNIHPRVLVSLDGDAIFLQGLARPALFVSAADIEQWTSAPTKALMTELPGSVCISTLAVLLEARAQFSVLSGTRPPSASQSGLCLAFEMTTGLRVACVDDDRVVIIDHDWFELRGFHLLVGPTLYHASKQPVPVHEHRDLARHFASLLPEAQLRRAHALEQLFATI